MVSPKVQGVAPGGVSAVRVGQSSRAKACLCRGSKDHGAIIPEASLPLPTPCRSLPKASRKACTDQAVATVTCPGRSWPMIHRASIASQTFSASLLLQFPSCTRGFEHATHQGPSPNPFAASYGVHST